MFWDCVYNCQWICLCLRSISTVRRNVFCTSQSTCQAQRQRSGVSMYMSDRMSVGREHTRVLLWQSDEEHRLGITNYVRIVSIIQARLAKLKLPARKGGFSNRTPRSRSLFPLCAISEPRSLGCGAPAHARPCFFALCGLARNWTVNFSGSCNFAVEPLEVSAWVYYLVRCGFLETSWNQFNTGHATFVFF